MTEQEWLGNNQLSLDIWHKKYQINNESFEEWLDRVSGGNSYVRQLIKDKKFLFGGRILASRGVTDRKVTYSNCYVITPPDDSIESIFDCAKKLARTYSYGGGCGVDISNLSPRGAKVNNAAKETTGSVSAVLSMRLGAAAVASAVTDSFPAGGPFGVVGAVKSSATALSGVRALLGCEPVAAILPSFVIEFALSLTAQLPHLGVRMICVSAAAFTVKVNVPSTKICSV